MGADSIPNKTNFGNELSLIDPDHSASGRARELIKLPILQSIPELETIIIIR